MSAITIVIPVWNGGDLLLRLLEKLRLQTFPISEVIAVDNGSQDGSAEEAERQGARVLRLGSNRGFSFAVNEGIEACRTELVALVNQDVEPEPDWLARLVAAISSDDTWFATGKILNALHRDRIDGTYDLISRAACSWRVGQGREDGAEFSKTRPIAMTSCTAALFRRALFTRVGLFDTTFESYLEDVDLGLRCALQNLKGVYAPEAVAYHRGSASLGVWSPAMTRLVARNQVFLVAKYFPLRRYGWPILVGQGLWGLVALRHRAWWAFVKGKIEGVRRFKSISRVQDLGGLSSIVEQSEREIREARGGGDLYWRLYFLLTAVGRIDT